MSKVPSLIQCLKDLQSVDYSSQDAKRLSHNKAEKALNLIFSIATHKTQFTDDEKKTIGPLLLNALKPIQINIEVTGASFRTKLEGSVLRKRSAIQFLMDDYGQFPADTSTLSAKFVEANLQRSMDILDDVIAKWADESDSDEGPVDYEEAGSSVVPPSHTWWSLVQA